MNENKIKLNYERYCDCVRACRVAKNIGGTMGGPYERKRETFDIQGFSTPPGKPRPNADPDLQLVWLHAVETRVILEIEAEGRPNPLYISIILIV